MGSIASMANSSRMWVMTGRMPRSAAPTATPVMAFSDTGMSRTRRGPYLSASPRVEPNTAAASGAPSPRTITRGSLAMDRSSASARAWTNLSCRVVPAGLMSTSRGVQVGRELIAGRKRARLREGHGVVDFDGDLAPHRCEVGVAHQVAPPQPFDVTFEGIAGQPRLVFARRTVAEMAIVQRPTVLEPAVGLELDKRGAVACPSVIDRLAGQHVHRIEVVAVALSVPHP